MRRITLRLIAAVLAFSVGVLVSHLTLPTRSAAPMAPNPPIPTSPSSKSERKYETGVMADGITRDGFRFAVTGFTSSDGMGFSRESIYYQSPQRATHQLKLALREATAVIRREPFPGKDGQPSGEKVIAIFRAKSKFGKASMLWTDGSTFRYLSSSSLQNLTQEEKDLNDSLP